VRFVRLANTLQKDEESARDNNVLAGNFAKYSQIKNVFTDRLSSKPFLIYLLIMAFKTKRNCSQFCIHN